MTRPAGYAGFAAGYALSPRSYSGFAVTRASIHVRAYTCERAPVRACACAPHEQPERNRVTRVTTRGYRVTHALPHRNHHQKEEEMGKGSMRDAMPGAAALVDELRAAFGREFIDAALRNGMSLQRTGVAGRGASIVVREGEQVVGAVPARPAAVLPRRGGVR